MEILGVGVPEFAFIVLIALILLGPKDMIAAGRTIGKVLRNFLTSPTWLALRRTGDELQQLPTKLVREAGLEDLQREVQGVTNNLRPAFDPKRIFDEAQVFDPNTELGLPKPTANPDSSSIVSPTVNLPDPQSGPITPTES